MSTAALALDTYRTVLEAGQLPAGSTFRLPPLVVTNRLRANIV